MQSNCIKLSVVVLIRSRRAGALKTLILALSLVLFYLVILDCISPCFLDLYPLRARDATRRNTTYSSFHSCLVSIRLLLALLARSLAVYVQHAVWKAKTKIRGKKFKSQYLV